MQVHSYFQQEETQKFLQFSCVGETNEHICILKSVLKNKLVNSQYLDNKGNAYNKSV